MRSQSLGSPDGHRCGEATLNNHVLRASDQGLSTVVWHLFELQQGMSALEQKVRIQQLFPVTMLRENPGYPVRKPSRDKMAQRIKPGILLSL